MVCCDKNFKVIMAGDILRLDNGKEYLVFLHKGRLIMQNIRKYSPPIILEKAAIRGRLSSATKIFNISDFDCFALKNMV